MSGSTAIYDLMQPVAFAGMKADSMDDNVDTRPAGGDIPFGRVCAFQGPNSHIVGVGPAVLLGPVAGISLHDHVIGAFGNRYRLHDAVSLLTRGRVWAEVSATATLIDFGTQVSFVMADGTVTGSTAGTAALPNAVFRSRPVVIPPLFPSTTLGAMTIALVELHYPMI
jgi:hypothetical protein